MTPAVVIRPILLPANSVNHRLPSGAATMPWGSLPLVGTGNSAVTTPAVVIRAILFIAGLENHRLPSGPAAMPRARCLRLDREVGDEAGGCIAPDLVALILREPQVAIRPHRDKKRLTAGCRGRALVTTPAVVMRPILLPLISVNQRLPSGPAVMKRGPLLLVVIGKSFVIAPAVVIRPILLVPFSVNHSAPSGPAVIPQGAEPVGNSVTCASALSGQASTAKPSTAKPGMVLASANSTSPRMGG